MSILPYFSRHVKKIEKTSYEVSLYIEENWPFMI